MIGVLYSISKLEQAREKARTHTKCVGRKENGVMARSRAKQKTTPSDDLNV